MNKLLFIVQITALVFFSSGGVLMAGGVGEGFSPQHSLVDGISYPAFPAYKDSYNYPHSLPPDYVFRTGRVFEPSASSFDWRNPLAFFRGEGGRKRVKPAESWNQGGPVDLGLPRQVAELAAKLMANGGEVFNDDYVLAVSTFVNLNDLYVTSSLGRYLAEQIVSELQLRGGQMVEIRKTPAIMIRQKEGEYGLSRDMDELSFVQGAQAVVTGTYSVSGKRIFLNARLLRNSDNMILSTASLTLEIDQEIRHMLEDEKTSGRALLRTSAVVPVRSFAETAGQLQSVGE